MTKASEKKKRVPIIDMSLKTFLSCNERSSITLWTIVHFLFGFLWYFIFYTIYKKKLEYKSKNEQMNAIINSFFLLFMFNIVWELFETTKLFEKIEALMFTSNKCTKTYKKGDSISNSIFDCVFACAGFWIGYTIFKFKHV